MASGQIEKTMQDNSLLELENLTKELSAILDSSSVGITKVVSRRQIRANRAMCEIFGYSQDELKNQETSQLYPSIEEFIRIGNEAYSRLNMGLEYNTELQMRRKDGNLIWIHLQGQAIDRTNPNEGSVWIFEDITDRKNTENALKESESRFKDFFEQSGDAFLIIDDGLFTDCNQATFKLLGFDSKNNVIFHSPAEFSPERQPDGRLSSEKANEMIEIAFTTGSNRFEWVHLKADGSEFPVEVLLTPMLLEGKVVLHVIWRDITERKQLEYREKARLKILEDIAAAVPIQDLLDAIVGFVEQGSDNALCSLLLANKEGTRLLLGSAPNLPTFYNEAVNGLKIKNGMGSCGTAAFLRKRVVVEEIEGHPHWKGFKPASDAGLRSCWSEPILSTDRELLGTFAVYHRKPSVPNDTDIALIESATHLASIAIERVRDNEQRVVLEGHIRQMQKFEAIGQLAGGIAHDFNNLLTPILIYAEMVQTSLGDGHPCAKKIDGIISAANKSKDLTTQLLSFGRKQDMNMTGFDLNEAIKSFKDILVRTVRGNIAFELNLAPYGAYILADKGQIEQVLLNLAVNAQDAIEGNGTVIIETAHVIIDDEYVKLNPDIKPGSYILLTFSDNGSGMTEDVVQHIFEPFYTTKEVGHGTGLGLATTFGIIKQHEGHINVRSKEGEGTAFGIYIPENVSALQAQIIKDTGVLQSSQLKKTILFVDDNKMIVDIATELLPLYGYKILPAMSPHQALAIAESFPGTIDLLITDLIMPEMNGIELYERLEEKFSALPVLYISGYKNDIVLQKGSLEERVNFISKPFTTEQLIGMIQEIIKERLTNSTHFEQTSWIHSI